jgi:hypothetical protein
MRRYTRKKRMSRRHRLKRGGLFGLFKKSKSKTRKIVPTDKPLSDEVIKKYNIYVEPRSFQEDGLIENPFTSTKFSSTLPLKMK